MYSEKKVVQFYFKSNAILKLHISSMLPVTSAIQSDILHLYLRAVDVYINVSHLPYMQSIRGDHDYCNSIDIAGSTIAILLLLWTTIAILL